MATVISNYYRGKILDLSFGDASWSAPDIYYVGLLTGAPNLNSNGTEANWGGYARKSYSNAAGQWTTLSDGRKANAAELAFDPITSGNGTVSWVALFDAATAGNLIIAVSVEPAMAFSAGNAPTIQVGLLKFDFGGAA